MLYYLFRFLEQFGIPGSRMWSYISFRALLALMLGLIISMWFGEYFIKWMKRHQAKVEEKKFDASIDAVAAKRSFVPSMGGIVIITAVVVPCLLFGRLRNIYMLLMLLTTVWFGLTGFLDDFLKIKKSKNGLAPRWKLLSQLSLGLVVGLTLYLSPDAVIRENVEQQRVGDRTEIVHKSDPVKSTVTTIPFVKNNNLDYASLAAWAGPYKQAIGWGIFVLVTVFFIMFVSNGANLNDGMDGMAAGNSAVICIALGILAYVSSHIEYAAYFNIMYVPGSQELVIFISALIGALLGFLWYNSDPAQVFMGDTGSLAIGGAIAVLAMIIHKELLLFLLCGVFLVELASSALQTRYSAWGTKHGRKQRLFKRAPIHDAFREKYDFQEGIHYVFRHRLSGRWADQKVTVRFWITSILLAAATIITLKIR
ncbi:MAG: phospho-N-acetylmuramoyl-pentapeptide-transferase [Bacteroidales bacterium]|nr:phospho-N-acetylmuramoyl-pentapeptide-transferase [Candidatus Equimonas enterica]